MTTQVGRNRFGGPLHDELSVRRILPGLPQLIADEIIYDRVLAFVTKSAPLSRRCLSCTGDVPRASDVTRGMWRGL